MSEIFHSIEDIWCIWLLCLVGVYFFVRVPMRKASYTNLLAFAKSERGASYALPYILSFPIYLLLMALLLQTTFIIVCKFGNVYSAHAAARAATVWQGVNKDNPDLGAGYAKYKTKRAAVMAMTPFANSSTSQREGLFPLYPATITMSDIQNKQIDLPSNMVNLLVGLDRRIYTQTYDRLLQEAIANDSAVTHQIIKHPDASAQSSYISRKYHYAAAATSVDYDGGVVPWNNDMTIKVSYRMAFHIPGTARFLGGKRYVWAILGFDVPFYRDIETEVTIQSEAAETDSGHVGIPYNPSLFQHLVEELVD